MRLHLIVLAAILAASAASADYREFREVPIDLALEADLRRAAEESLREFPNLEPEDLAIAVVDITNPSKPVRGDYNGNRPFYPASVIKIFHMADIYMQNKQDLGDVDRALREMIVVSDNDATAYLVDILAGTCASTELEGRALERFIDQRRDINRHFQRLGYDISAMMKPWSFGPYGRELQLLGQNRENRNRLTANATAALLLWIARGRAPGSEAMMELLHRPLDTPRDDENQIEGFIGEALPAGSRLWSKAGWTSEVRLDSAIVELPTGRKLVLVIFTRGQSREKNIVTEIARNVLGAATAFAQGPPELKLTTRDAYDPAGVQPYRGRHQKVYDYIDAHQAEHFANIQRWVRQPSISAQNRGIAEMAAMVRDDLRRIGFKEVEIVPTSGHPSVVGFYDAGAKKTLAVYMMYDVQPIEPEGWKVDAFEGALVDHDLGRALMARGATNQKGPQRAFLNAVESIIAVDRKLPVNLLVIAEGEEELGSPNFPETIARYEERLRNTSGVIFPMFGQDRDGAVTINLGVKGIVYFEMEARGNESGGPVGAEVHGSLKAIIDSPVWRLTQALASLTSKDGNTITVPRYYDSIRPPNQEEQRLVNSMLRQWPAREASMKRALDVRQWANDWTGEQVIMNLLFNTTLNIDGIWGGYTGPGVKTILPHKATAKVDSRLVPNQTPEEALRLIRQHLDNQGFTDVTIRRLGGYPPAQTSVSAPLVQQAIGVYNKYGFTPALTPRLAGSAPYYVFTNLGLPLLAAGIGHGSGAHAPNEYIIVEPKPGSKIVGLAGVEKFYVDLLYAVSR